VSTGTDWRGDSEGSPVRFGRKARAWLRRRLLARMFIKHPTDAATYCADGVEWDEYSVNLALAWYMEHPMRYTHWTDNDEYRGHGWSNGAWEFDDVAVQKDWRQAVDFVDRTLDAEKCLTVDEWLAADSAGTLWYRGARSGMERVARENQSAPRRKRCPCGTRFKPKRRNAVHCPACIAAAKAERVTATTQSLDNSAPCRRGDT
jgi:hypothetical protein